MRDELTICELLNLFSKKYSHKEICKMSDTEKATYCELLNHFQAVNGNRASKAEKGAALENLVSFLIKVSGNIFTVSRNVRTNTNEIDQIVRLNEKGRGLLAAGVLPKRFELFLGECKNHAASIGVGYIGKFYSLLQTTDTRTGILFSYHGISGSKWSHGSGLVRKIYLQREREEDRVAIIDFCIQDFQAVADGGNFIEIVANKLDTLQFDTSISSFISQHPAEPIFAESNI